MPFFAKALYVRGIIVVFKDVCYEVIIVKGSYRDSLGAKNLLIVI